MAADADEGPLPLSQQVEGIRGASAYSSSSSSSSSSSHSSSSSSSSSSSAFFPSLAAASHASFAAPRAAPEGTVRHMRVHGALKSRAWSSSDVFNGIPIKFVAGEAFRLATLPLALAIADTARPAYMLAPHAEGDEDGQDEDEEEGDEQEQREGAGGAVVGEARATTAGSHAAAP